MSFVSSLRDAFRRPASPPPAGRRQFVRRASALGALTAGGGLLLPDEAWAGIEERAARFGIVPGTVVDARGRAVEPSGNDVWVGELMLCGWNFAARNYAFANGQILQIAQNTALFSLLGTTYGGDGRTTFGVPDLRGRYAIGAGRGPGLQEIRLGQKGGAEDVTLTAAQNGSHTHSQPVNDANGTSRSPSNNVPARPGNGEAIYGTSATTAFSPTNPAGAGQPHNNMAPYLTLNYQIALSGVYPSRS